MNVIEILMNCIVADTHADEEYTEQVRRIADSIKQYGLFHPITVRPPNDQGVYKLASGGKRLAAFKLLKKDIIPCVIRSVQEGEPEAITHIHENLYRYNLPWYEQVALEKTLHELRIAQFGQGRPGKKSGWSLRETANELGMSFGVLSEDIRIAEVIESDPNLKKIGDKKTAKKIILEGLKRLSQEAEATCDIIGLDYNRIYLGSSEEILKAFPQQVFHACITDPPWIKFASDDKLIKDENTLEVFKQVFRVLAPNAFLIMFVSTEDFYVYKNDLSQIGYTIQQTPNIWIKEGHLTQGKRSWEYCRDYEPILVAVKGSPALTSPMLSAIFSCAIVPPQKMIHPNEKPKGVIHRLIDNCTYNNALILDPFCGSGVVCEVAAEMQRKFVGIERDPGYYMKALKRLKKSEHQDT